MKNITNKSNLKKPALAVLLFFITTYMHAQDTAKVELANYCIITTNAGVKVSGLMTGNENGKVKVIDPTLGELNIEMTKIASMKVAETGKKYTFRMSNGNSYTGIIVQQNATVLTVNVESVGEVFLSLANILDFGTGEISGQQAQQTFDHASRYLLAPSAIPLKKGEGYYQNVMILMSGAQYGITDNFSVGGGVIVPIGFFATAKYGVRAGDHFHVAAGGMLVSTFIGGSFGVGCGFGSITYGNRGSNLTFTAGYGGVGAGGDWAITKRPILNISGMLKITEGFSLVTENWLIPQRKYTYNPNYSDQTVTNTYSPQYSFGFRIGAGKHSFDLAGLAINGRFVMPYFAYAYRFNNPKAKR